VIKDPGKAAIRISLAVSVLMLAGKLTAYFLTHSTAILGDALESVVHCAATGLAALAYWYAAKPADPEHTYGHGRIAYFSAGFEGALVLAAALAVMASGIRGLLYGPDLKHVGAGLAITGALALINLALGIFLIRVGRKQNAMILIANGKHVLSDVWTTAAAVIGLTLVLIFRVDLLDPIAALVISVVIMTGGVSLVKGAYRGLMDKADPAVRDALIRELRERQAEGLIEQYHQLRCRGTENELWIDVHLLLPGELKLESAHTRVTLLEEALRGLFPDRRVYVTSHIEPVAHADAHPEGHEGVPDPLAQQNPPAAI